MTMIVGKSGDKFALPVGFDISGALNLEIKFTKPNGQVLTVSTPEVTAPTADLVDDDGTVIPGGTYMQYTFQPGDVDIAGVWCICGTYQDGTPKVFPSLSAKERVYPAC